MQSEQVDETARWWHHSSGRGGDPMPSDQNLATELTEQEGVGRRILRMPLQPDPLEVLNQMRLAIGLTRLRELLADRIAEDVDASVAVPVVEEAAGDRVARLRDIDRPGAGGRCGN